MTLKNILYSSLAAGLILIGSSSVARSQPMVVQTNTICELEAVIDLAVNLQDSMSFETGQGYVTQGKCFQFPVAAMEIIRVVGGAYTDAEGDKFFVVQVGGNPGAEVFTIAWPGHNSNLKQPVRFQI